MATTWQLPGYVALARSAASVLGAANDATARAILARWQCEQPNPAPWPPLHNNPGNLTTAIGGLDGTPHGIATSAPGAGLLYTYATPGAGAIAYARYLAASSRYRSAIAAARAGDGVGFLQGVCSGGYGTNLGCCGPLFPHVVLPGAPVAGSRWRCAASLVNIRSGPGTGYPIVGAVRVGTIVTGPWVNGGPYVGAGKTYTGWVNIGTGRYVAAAFFRKLS